MYLLVFHLVQLDAGHYWQNVWLGPKRYLEAKLHEIVAEYRLQ